MAIIGESLLQAESGWKRIDSENNLIQYNGEFIKSNNNAEYFYNGYTQVSVGDTANKGWKFFFTGKNVRLIAYKNPSYAQNISVYVDGVKENFAIGGSITKMAIVYEKLDLEDKAHELIVINENDGLPLNLDAIDIDEIGSLLTEDEFNNIRNEKPAISHKNASLTYILPMATTKEIKAKKNDSREGLLGMANDPENFGDLYVVGTDGKSHLTKSGIKSDVLFEGEANSVGVYSLEHDISNYKHLIVYGYVLYSSSIKNPVSTTIDTNDCITDETMAKNYSLMIHRLLDTGAVTWSATLLFSFPSKEEFRVIALNKFGNHDGLRISKIIGVY